MRKLKYTLKAIASIRLDAVARCILTFIVITSLGMWLTKPHPNLGIEKQILADKWYYLALAFSWCILSGQVYLQRLHKIVAIANTGLLAASLTLFIDEVHFIPTRLGLNDIIGYSISSAFIVVSVFKAIKSKDSDLGIYSKTSLAVITLVTLCFPLIKLSSSLPVYYIGGAALILIMAAYTLFYTLLFSRTVTRLFALIFLGLASNNLMDEILGIATVFHYSEYIVGVLMIISAVLFHKYRNKEWMRRFLAISE